MPEKTRKLFEDSFSFDLTVCVYWKRMRLRVFLCVQREEVHQREKTQTANKEMDFRKCDDLYIFQIDMHGDGMKNVFLIDV